jgi:hypothetical protein
MDRSVMLQMPANLSSTHELRDTVDTLLFRYPEDVREAASMVASELVENALKHGVSLPHLHAPMFCLSCEGNNICIEVASGSTSARAVNQLKERIERITDADNKEELYLSRLFELMENRPQVGQLGLYRIGYEGRFKLSCEYCNEILSVKATRGLS